MTPLVDTNPILIEQRARALRAQATRAAFVRVAARLRDLLAPGHRNKTA